MSYDDELPLGEPEEGPEESSELSELDDDMLEDDLFADDPLSAELADEEEEDLPFEGDDRDQNY